MFGLGDLFQWERFVTPTVIKVFYWLAVVISVLLGIAGAVSSLQTMAFNPLNSSAHHQPARRLRRHHTHRGSPPNSCSSCFASMSISARGGSGSRVIRNQ